MSAIGIHIAQRCRGSTIAEQVHEFVDALWAADVEAGNCSTSLPVSVHWYAYLLPELLSVSMIEFVGFFQWAIRLTMSGS